MVECGPHNRGYWGIEGMFLGIPQKKFFGVNLSHKEGKKYYFILSDIDYLVHAIIKSMNVQIWRYPVKDR